MSQTLQIMRMGEQIAELEWQLNQVLEDNDYYQKENEELQEENKQAKEIIEKYLAIGVGGKITQNYLDVTKEAEQFLKE